MIEYSAKIKCDIFKNLYRIYRVVLKTQSFEKRDIAFKDFFEEYYLGYNEWRDCYHFDIDRYLKLKESITVKQRIYKIKHHIQELTGEKACEDL